MDFRRRMRPLPLSHVKITDRFWGARQRALIGQGLEHQYQQLVMTGRIENFRKAKRKEHGTFEGYRFNDSDAYKWLEACAYALAVDPNARIRERIDEVVQLIEEAQEPDGYLNTYVQVNHPEGKWRNLNSMHEMYCGGHLIEGGVAMLHATGDRRLLEIGIRFADHVASIFGPGKRKGYCGHEEIELALIKLADATGNESYRDLSEWMVLQRGTRPSPFEEELSDPVSNALAPFAKGLLCKDEVYTGEYLQDHVPVEEQSDVVGHAVRAMYLYIAAAEFAEKRPKIAEAMQRAWANLTQRRMYLTGGIGPSGDNEGFTFDFDLPNRSAYAETCAAIGLVFWGRKLLEFTGNGEVADTVERALYNGTMSGISLDATRYFYTNPLESRGEHQRVPWFACACCPPNIARMVLSVADSILSVGTQAGSPEIWLHIPAGLEADLGAIIPGARLVVESGYPWSGRVVVSVESQEALDLTLRVRMPDWCSNCTVDQPDGEPESTFLEGYLVLTRTWRTGDQVAFSFEMAPKWVGSDPRVLDNFGRAALTHGPLVYCLEDKDFGYAPQAFQPDLSAEPVFAYEPDFLDGVGTLQVEGQTLTQVASGELYGDFEPPTAVPTSARFIPYFAWCNRGPNGMAVWFEPSAVPQTGPEF
ncbi:MAG: glycoside hydrolase family 127 protein [Armatimonadetes bacterium]|nr:glycoside hydrolase family 127 protein [Armatimonadota bacterium]